MAPRAPIIFAMLLATAFALILPAYSGPDEMGHVAYVAALAQGHLPIIPNGQVADATTGVSWQGQHPPLFYLLATPFYLLLGQTPLLGLCLLRLLGVAALGVTVALVNRIAALLAAQMPADSPQDGRWRTAGWILAAHPTVSYICAMANNEAMAMALAVACVWAALKARQAAEAEDKPKAVRRWLLWATLLGGLSLLTKLTAIAGVAAAACIVAQTGLKSGATDSDRRASSSGAMMRGLLILAGAVALWLPWGLYMHSIHGTFVPSPLQRPALNGGLWALTLFPQTALILTFVSTSNFALGMVAPGWLLAGYAFAYYPLLGVGWLLTAWVLYTTARHPKFRFLGVGFATLWVLLINQMLFRDVQTGLFMARYSPIVTALASVAAAAFYQRQASRTRHFIGALWSLAAVLNMGYIFYFFLIGSSSGHVSNL